MAYAAGFLVILADVATRPSDRTNTRPIRDQGRDLGQREEKTGMPPDCSSPFHAKSSRYEHTDNGEPQCKRCDKVARPCGGGSM
jgi:hypothetical protein